MKVCGIGKFTIKYIEGICSHHYLHMAANNTLNTVLLIIIAAVALALCILAAIYVLVYWSEKSEVWRTIIPRIFIIISLTLVYFIPLLIPIDVSIKYLAPDLNFMNLVW